MRTTVIRRAAAVAAVLVVGGGLGLGAVAAGGGEAILSDATVDPNPSQPGDDVAVRPTSAEDTCQVEVLGSNAAGSAGGSGVVLQWALLDPPSTVIDSGTETVGIDGSWEVALTAPDAGTYQFEAACVDFLFLDGFVTYDEELVVVAGADPEFDAELERASGPPGQAAELTASGCAGSSGAAAFLEVGEPGHPFDIGDNLLSQFDVLDGQFGGVVPVLATVLPGTYQVAVWCMEGDEVLDFESLGYTVTPVGAAPVPGDPDFTG